MAQGRQLLVRFRIRRWAAICRWHLAMHITSVERFGGVGLPALFAPGVIATKIHRDRVEPSREFRVRLKPPNPKIEPHKSLLQEVSRGLLVAGVAPDEPEKRLLIFAHQLIERTLIARLQSTHKRQIEVCLRGPMRRLASGWVTSVPERREGHER